ncbi:hypothetical protein BDV18DRAFT_128856 [Aspergillus unguis]
MMVFTASAWLLRTPYSANISDLRASPVHAHPSARLVLLAPSRPSSLSQARLHSLYYWVEFPSAMRLVVSAGAPDTMTNVAC